MSVLSISLLGGFHVEWNTHPLTEFESNKVRALLAYLAVEAERAHSRSALAGLLWPEHPERMARTNLRHVLSQLRHSLSAADNSPQLLHATHQTIQFRPNDAVFIDVQRFVALLDACQECTHRSLDQCDHCIPRFTEAANLYRGDFLAGFSLQDSASFDEWLVVRRENLHRRALELFYTLTEYHEAREAYPQAQEYALHQIALEPWREEAHRQLMRVLARSDQRSAALAQFEQCRTVLMDELGVEPAPETVALYEQIRHGQLGTPQNAQLAAPQPELHAIPSPQQDWSDVPATPYFYGREVELAQLKRWLLGDGTTEPVRLVTVLAMGGMGKTSLAAQVARQVSGEFEFVFWRSLVNAPLLSELLPHALQFLARQQLVQCPEHFPEQLALLFHYLRQHRCLLVLDNVESILEPELTGQYRAGYEAYGQLFERMAQSEHQSCLVLTSRESPHGIRRFEEDFPWVHTLWLGGLEEKAAQALLKTRGLTETPELLDAMVQRYSGNPLALKLVARTIQELFNGSIASFLEYEALIFDDIRTVLEQQFERLSRLEREIVIWLAVEREGASITTLAGDLTMSSSQRELMEALHGLQRRSLLEKTEAGFTLQNVVAEYVIEHLIKQICAEIEGRAEPAPWHDGATAGSQPLIASAYLNRFALLKAQAKAYIRQSQIRLILNPIAQRLTARLGEKQLELRFGDLLDALRAQSHLPGGYAGGNILNLLLHLGWDLRPYDFSHLPIRQAYLRGAKLLNVQLQATDLADSVFTDTFGMINSLAFSPDGHLVAGGTIDGEIRLWRANDGSPVGTFVHRNAAVWSVAFSPDGALLASTGEEPTIHLQQTHDGALHATLRGAAEGFNAIAFSPDGTVLAGVGYDATVYLWRVPPPTDGAAVAMDVEPICAWGGHVGTLFSAAFSPDGALLATGGSDMTIRLWDVESGETLQILRGHSDRIYAVAFSPDGTLLASSGVDATIRIWDVESGELRRVLEGHADVVRSVAFSPDGTLLASGSYDELVRLWDVASGEPRYLLPGHGGWIRTVAFSPNGGTLASGGIDATVRLWTIQQQSGQLRHALQGYGNFTRTLAFSPDGATLAGGGDDRTVHLWDVETCLASGGYTSSERQLRGHTKTIRSLAFSPGGETLASASFDKTLRLWNMRQPEEPPHVLRGHTGWIRSVAFSPGGKSVASASWDQTVCIWDARRGYLRHQLRGHAGYVWAVAFSPDGQRVASGGEDHTVRLWHVQRGEEEAVLRDHTQAVKTVAFHPSGRLLASGGDDHTVRLWFLSGEAAKPSSLLPLPGHTDTVWSIAFSPDGRFMASGSADGTIQLWDTAQLDALLPDATALCSAPSRPVHASNVSAQQVDSLTLRGHGSWVWSVAFHPDSKMLASCSLDQTIKLWDVQTGECLQTVRDRGPYAGMNISGATGISAAQRAVLKTLGAVEDEVL